MAFLTKLFVAAFVFAAIGFTTTINPTAARAFERLADGRIAVEIFGQKVAVPATDVDLDLVGFYTSQAAQTTYGKPIFTLREALLDVAKARSTFDLEQSFVMVRIITEPTRGTDNLILGRFRPESVPWSGAASPLTIMIRKSALGKPPKRGALPDHWPPESAAADEDGYFVRPGVRGPTQERASDTGHRLPAVQRLWSAKSDLVVVCTWVGAPIRQCKQSQQTSDGQISVSWSWYEEQWRSAGGHTSVNYFPKPRWKELDLRLHEVVDYLLINKPSGDLE